MSLTIEDAQFVSQMRMKMLKNMQEDKPAEADIDRDELKRALDIVRQSRSIGDATGSKAKAKAPVIPMDLDAFMNKPVGDKS